MSIVQQTNGSAAAGRVVTRASAVLLLLGLATLRPGWGAAATPPAVGTPRPVSLEVSSPAQLYEQLLPAVVTIVVTDKNDNWIGTGSGFFVDHQELATRKAALQRGWWNTKPTTAGDATTRAYVITNYHVIRKAISADVGLANGGLATVETIVAEDEDVDLALLCVKLPAATATNGLRLAKADPPIFTSVYTIGSPRGLLGSASAGHVSGYPYQFEDRLQTTAPISPGSSGGPLLLADGTLAGVTTETLEEAQNINFAVPASSVRRFLETAAFVHRDVAAGASVRWHEEDALRRARTWIVRPLYGSRTVEAAVRLEEAWKELCAGTETGDASRCERAIEKAQETGYSLPDHHQHLAHYVIGKASMHLALCEDAEVALGHVHDREKHIRYRANTHAQTAEENLLQTVAMRRDFAPAHLLLARHYAHGGQWADALLCADEAAECLPRSAEALALRAECFRKLRQLDSARSDLEAATDLDPWEGRLHLELGNVLVELAEYDRAIESYEEALAGVPTEDRAEVRYRLAIAYHKSGNREKALAEFTTAKALGWSPELCDGQIAELGQLSAPSTITTQARRPNVIISRLELDNEQETVYVTKTGKKYHREGCKHLRRSKIPLPLGEASKSYGPCSHCRPPTP